MFYTFGGGATAASDGCGGLSVNLHGLAIGLLFLRSCGEIFDRRLDKLGCRLRLKSSSSMSLRGRYIM